MTAALAQHAPAPLLGLERRANGVALVTLARPQARNALSLAMLDALTQTFADLGADPNVRAIVLTAQGPVFSSGHDLKEITGARAQSDGGKAFFEDTLARCARFMQSLLANPKAIIAAVEGVATAAGCQLVASCDLAVAGADARFCTPGVNIGLFCSTPMVALSRNLSRKHAMEMLLLGDMVGADDAHRFGLVNRVTPRGEALAVALALAEQIASKSTLTVKIGKRAFYEQVDMSVPDAYLHAGRAMLENLMAQDAQEGVCALLDKRPAKWRDC